MHARGHQCQPPLLTLRQAWIELQGVETGQTPGRSQFNTSLQTTSALPSQSLCRHFAGRLPRFHLGFSVDGSRASTLCATRVCMPPYRYSRNMSAREVLTSNSSGRFTSSYSVRGAIYPLSPSGLRLRLWQPGTSCRSSAANMLALAALRQPPHQQRQLARHHSQRDAAQASHQATPPITLQHCSSESGMTEPAPRLSDTSFSDCDARADNAESQHGIRRRLPCVALHLRRGGNLAPYLVLRCATVGTPEWRRASRCSCSQQGAGKGWP